MKKIKRFSIAVIIVLIAVGCSEDLVEDLVVKDKTELDDKIVAVEKDSLDYYVSQQQAIEVANAHFINQAKVSGLRSNVTMESEAFVDLVKEEKSNELLMYVINYPEGGWAIVSATKSFYPLLAYSDENSFDQSDMGPSDLWFTNTKEAIKSSKSLDESTSGEIRSVWNEYTMDDKSNLQIPNLKNSSSLQTALNTRMDQLIRQYGHSYIISTLGGTQGVLGDKNEWQSLQQYANSLNSPPQYTILVGRKDYKDLSVGPLLQTKWHQDSPFNDLAPSGRTAGCAAIAVAQVMKYHQYPQNMTWNGFSFNMGNVPIPSEVGSVPQAALARLVGGFINMHYMNLGSWTIPSDVESGMKQMGYNVTRRNHNYNSTHTQLLTYKRPVIMVGSHMNLPLPSPLNYLGKSHYWVCDGARDYEYSISYFIEFINQSNNTYYNHPHIYNPSNLFKSHQFRRIHFHMNWGWRGKNDGWYLHYDVKSEGGDFQYSRQDFYISKS